MIKPRLAFVKHPLIGLLAVKVGQLSALHPAAFEVRISHMADDSLPPRQIESYYNGACPVCRAEMDTYRRACERDGNAVLFVDVSQAEAVSDHLRGEVSQDQALRRLHVRAADGTLVSGVDAFLVLWRAMPRMRWLAWFVSLPLIYSATTVLYDHVIAPLIYRWRGRHITAALTPRQDDQSRPL